MSSSHVGIWSESSGAKLFEVLIEVPSSPECHYVTEMQKSTKSLGGSDRESIKGDRGKAGREGETVRVHKRDGRRRMRLRD